ncbi:MAG: two-component system, OmpR family, phosphate regulon sensor histidine kinase PhoR [Alphaproteobacteria bacterium]|jgi:two-component system phosphate regulon sensor histidine kinase PhoR|nr:two-component system, OmpR family, phosphate regulon sensor histidine kinase PhoR [Alphaproteobacteria bacterium]
MPVILNNETDPRTDRWVNQFRRARIVLVAAAVVFAVFWAMDALAAALALGGFAVVAIAAIAMARSGETARHTTSQNEPPPDSIGHPLVEAMLMGLPHPVIALSLRGDVIGFNALASTIAPALRRSDPISLGLRVPVVLDAIRRTTISGNSQRVEFFERVPIDRWYEATVTLVAATEPGRHLSPNFLLITFYDLTPLRRVEEMRADFVANASHELRTPLAALSGFIDTLQGAARDDTAARQRFLPIMQAQATRMARLIDDLLSLSRIELNAHLPPQTRVELIPIVRQVTDGLQTLARDRDVKILVNAPAEPLIVLGDRDELIRVFENLIENALKYGASGKRVEINFSQGETADGLPETRVAVRDFGPGIAPEHMPRLTERFYRVDVADSRAQGGTGLGLALAKHILNRHRGRLSIASVPGAGATFTVHLPVPRANPPAS